MPASPPVLPAAAAALAAQHRQQAEEEEAGAAAAHQIDRLREVAVGEAEVVHLRHYVRPEEEGEEAAEEAEHLLPTGQATTAARGAAVG